MSSEIAILSDLSEFNIFKAINADVYIVARDEVKQKLLDLVVEYKVIYFSENLQNDLEAIIQQYDENIYPIITALPTSNGSTDAYGGILKLAKQTLGIDIFKE